MGGLFAPSGTYTSTQPAQPNPNGNPHNANGMQPGVGKLPGSESDDESTVSTKDKKSKDSKGKSKKDSKDKRSSAYYPSGDNNPRNANHPGAHEPNNGGFDRDENGSYYGGDQNPRNSDQPGAHDPNTAGDYYRYGGNHKRSEKYLGGDENPRNSDQPGAHKSDSAGNYLTSGISKHFKRSTRIYPSGDENARNSDKAGAHQADTSKPMFSPLGNDYYSQFDTDSSNPRNAHGLQPGRSKSEKRLLFGNDYYSQYDTDPSNPRNAHGLQPGLSKSESAKSEKRESASHSNHVDKRSKLIFCINIHQ